MHKTGKLIIYHSFEEWQSVAQEIGWVHIHDDLVVCDTDMFCAGEWDDETSTGYIIEDYINE